ncbi:MAG: hypothetical protein JXD19_04205, partial [Deltaproteobacteria bacterium]|nr:hypothetical protein [Deltaproteobacteria bacterium]
EEIEAIPQEEDLARIQQMTLQKKLEDLRKLNDPAQTAKLQGAIAYLDTKIRQLQETAESLLERQDRITEKIALVHGELTTSEEEAADLRDEIDAVTERSQTEKGDPTVKVSGTIRSATQIIGPHTSFTADEDYHHVVIKEVKITQPDAPVTWSIDISPFK